MDRTGGLVLDDDGTTYKYVSHQETEYINTSLYERFVMNPEHFLQAPLKQLNAQLLDAVASGESEDRILHLLRAGAQESMAAHQGDTLLHTAARFGHRHLVRFFLARGHDYSRTNDHNQTPPQVADATTKDTFFEDSYFQLNRAAQRDDLESFVAISGKLSKHDMLDHTALVVALHISCQYGSTKILDHLIYHKNTSVHDVTGVGMTGLHYAVIGNQYGIIRALLQHGADPLVEDAKGRTCFDLARNRVVQRALRYGLAMQDNATQAVPSLQPTGSNKLEQSHWRLHKHSSASEAGNERCYLDSWRRSDFLVDAFFQHEYVEPCNSVQRDDDSLEYDTDCGDINYIALRNPDTNKLPIHFHDPRDFRKPCEEDEGNLGRMSAQVMSTSPFCDEVARNVVALIRQKLELATDHHQHTEFVEQFRNLKSRKNFHKNESTFTSFVLTDENGYRTYCYCLSFETYVVSESRPDDYIKVRTLGVVSKWPVYSFFSEYMGQLIKHSHHHDSETKMTTQASAFVDLLLTQPFPPRNQSSISCFIEDQPVRLGWPKHVALPFVDDCCFGVLCSVLGINSILQIVSALLTEQSVVVMSKQLEVLTPCMEAIVALLFPLEWRHTYIPILPDNMIGITEAPSPFFIGLHANLLGEISGERLASLLLVNLDIDSIVLPIEPLFACSFELDFDEHDDAEGVQVPVKPNEFVMLPQDVMEQIQNTLRPVCTEIKERFTDQLEANTNIISMQTGLNESIDRVRNTVLRGFVGLFGKLSVFDFARSAQITLLSSLTNAQHRAFLRRLFSTSIWQCMVDDVTGKSVSTMERDVQLEAFKRMVDGILQLEKYRVMVRRLPVYQDPSLGSAIIGCKHRDDLVLLSYGLPFAKGDHKSWFKLRDLDGWCFVNLDEEVVLVVNNETSSETQETSQIVASKCGTSVNKPSLPVGCLGNESVYVSSAKGVLREQFAGGR